MGRAEREHPRVVDQNIDMAVAEIDRPSRHFAGARRVSKVRRNKIRLPSCGANLSDRLLAALDIAAYDQDMDAKLGEFIGGRPPARPRSARCCGWRRRP